MDKTVPPGAAILLDFTRKTETGRADRASYDVIYGQNQNKLSKPITSMTLGELVDQQSSFTKRFKSSASGAYQFMMATLQGLARELNISDKMKFDPDLQDRLGYHLLKRRGYFEYVSGEITIVEFGRRLAQEWASFPVLAPTKGAHAFLRRGQSYYAGDALNKALVKPVAFEAMLRAVKRAHSESAQNEAAVANKPPEHLVPEVKARSEAAQATKREAAKSLSKSKRFWTWALTVLGTPLAAFGALDWRVQLALVAVLTCVGIYAVTSMPQVRKLLGLA